MSPCRDRGPDGSTRGGAGRVRSPPSLPAGERDGPGDSTVTVVFLPPLCSHFAEKGQGGRCLGLCSDRHQRRVVLTCSCCRMDLYGSNTRSLNEATKEKRQGEETNRCATLSTVRGTVEVLDVVKAGCESCSRQLWFGLMTARNKQYFILSLMLRPKSKQCDSPTKHTKRPLINSESHKTHLPARSSQSQQNHKAHLPARSSQSRQNHHHSHESAPERQDRTHLGGAAVKLEARGPYLGWILRPPCDVRRSFVARCSAAG